MKENFAYIDPDYGTYIDALLSPESLSRTPITSRTPTRIGIQSRGEMSAGALEYFKSLGWNMNQLKTESRVLAAKIGPDLTIFKLRVPSMLDALRVGALDMAILGADVIAENNLSDNPVPIAPLKSLGFGDCKFCMGFPYDSPIEYPLDWNKIKDILRDATVATSLPNILKMRFRRDGIPINENKIIVMDGSVETAISLYGVRAIADRVSTGNTMFANGVRPELTLAYFPGAFLLARQDFLNDIIK